MYSAYSTINSKLFSIGSHQPNTSSVLVTPNVFHQDPSSRDISLNSKYIVLCKIPRDKTQTVNLAREIYPENIYSFHKTYLDAWRDPHTYLFWIWHNQLTIY